ncbi:MAG TPA: hypothetical protein VJV87_04970 [Sphingomicrobium sp.]|nr:hypothetical protein [Sphingomicrobium sp.]
MLATTLALFLAQTAVPSLPSSPPPPACTGAEHGQFDFWVGEWTVTPTGKPNVVATSLIEKLYGGCAVRGNWIPAKGTPGGSLNSYVGGRWHQTWVDAANSRVEFVGGLVNGKMILTGDWQDVNGPGKDAIIRMTYSKNADGSVRQHGEQSTDFGLTWSTSFDFTYHPKANPSG